MAATNTATTSSPNTVIGGGHDRISVIAGTGATAAAAPQTPDYGQAPRPAWLPQQWKKPEDLVESYKELQAHSTRVSQELAALKGGAPSTNGTTPVHPLSVPLPASSTTESLTAVAAAALTGTDAASTGSAGSTPAVSPTGTPALSTPVVALETIEPVDLKALSKEWSANGGKLTEASLSKLSKKGITSAEIEIFVRGQTALAAEYTRPIVEAAGGEDRLKLVTKWHGDVKSDAALRYNTALDAGDYQGAILIMAGMSAQYNDAVGRDPRLAISGAEAGRMATEEAFQSMAEVTAAMSDRRYTSDPAYQQMVVRRTSMFRRLQAAGQIRR